MVQRGFAAGFSLQKDFEASRKKREEAIGAKQGEKDLHEARLRTSEMMVGQHKSAIAMSKEDLARLRYNNSGACCKTVVIDVCAL